MTSSTKSTSDGNYMVALPPDAPRCFLILGEDENASQVWELTEPVTIVGWGGASMVQIADRTMSKMQCLVVHTGHDILLCDLHSPNRTQLNGKQVFRAPLADGDRISIGRTTLVVRIESDGPGHAPQASDPLKMPGKLALRDTVSPEEASLENALTLVGRREKLDVYLEDSAISPAHALIFPFCYRPMIRDLGSRTGVEINGQQREFCPLNGGDLLRMGPFEVKIVLSGWPAPCSPPAAKPATSSDRRRPQPSTAVPRRNLRPERPPMCPEDLGGLDQLRQKVALLCEELFAYRNRLESWERDLSSYARELSAKADRQPAPSGQQEPTPQGASDHRNQEHLSAAWDQEADLPPEQALERFNEALDRVQSMLGPDASPDPADEPAVQDRPGGEDKPEPANLTPGTADSAGQQAETADPSPEPAAEAGTGPDPEPADASPNQQEGQDTDDAGSPAAAKADVPPDEVLEDRPKYDRINSLDLDPEVADRLRLMRRLNPQVTDADLLEQILSEREGRRAKSATKKSKPSWWLRR